MKFNCREETMEKSNRNKITAAFDTVSFVALCAVAAYCVVLGTSSILTFGGFSLWSVLIVILLATALPAVLFRFKTACANPFMCSLLALAAYLAVEFFRTLQNGYTVGNIIPAITGLAYFVTFPFVAAILSVPKRTAVLSKVVMYAGFAMSVITVLFFVVFLFAKTPFRYILNFFWQKEYINFTYISDKLCRILFVTTPLQLFSCAASVYFQIKSQRFSWWYAIVTALGLFCMFITFTRALYLAALVTAAAVIVLLLIHSSREQKKKMAKHVLAAVLICALLIAAFSLAAGYNYFGFAINRTVGTQSPMLPPSQSGDILQEQEDSYLNATQVSDEYRQQITVELREVISKNPVFGVGFVYQLEIINRMPEYFFLDLWAKIGLVGLALYLLPFILSVIVAVRLTLKKKSMCSVLWVSVLAGMLTYSLFQPYMQVAPCVFLYACTLAVVNSEQTLDKNEV